MERFRLPHHVGFKGPSDVVTEVDRLAEDHIVSQLLAAFPSHQVLAEEGHHPTSTDAPLWVVDPLDGTRNYARGVPFFCVSIALQVAGKTVLGVIHDPIHDETFSGRLGEGAELNGHPLTFSRKPKLEESIVAAGSMPARNPADRNLALPIYMRARPLVEAIRMSGSVALNLAYVACGRWDISLSDNVHPWDVLAGALLIEETGGVVSELGGRPLSLTSRDILAANQTAFHHRMLQLAQQVMSERAATGP